MKPAMQRCKAISCLSFCLAAGLRQRRRYSWPFLRYFCFAVVGKRFCLLVLRFFRYLPSFFLSNFIYKTAITVLLGWPSPENALLVKDYPSRGLLSFSVFPSNIASPGFLKADRTFSATLSKSFCPQNGSLTS